MSKQTAVSPPADDLPATAPATLQGQPPEAAGQRSRVAVLELPLANTTSRVFVIGRYDPETWAFHPWDGCVLAQTPNGVLGFPRRPNMGYAWFVNENFVLKEQEAPPLSLVVEPVADAEQVDVSLGIYIGNGIFLNVASHRVSAEAARALEGEDLPRLRGEPPAVVPIWCPPMLADRVANLLTKLGLDGRKELRLRPSRFEVVLKRSQIMKEEGLDR